MIEMKKKVLMYVFLMGIFLGAVGAVCYIFFFMKTGM